MPPRIAREFFELQNPDLVYNEQGIAALIANALTPETPQTDFLILASPGDGLSTIGRDLEQHIRQMSLTDFNFAMICTDEQSPEIFPPGIRSLFGGRLKRPLDRLRANWDSLRVKEKFSYALVYLGAIVAVNIAVTAWGAFWGKNSGDGTIDIADLFALRSIASVAGVTILGTLIPAAVIAYWKAFWRSLSDEDINAQVDELVSLARRNNYRCLVKLFQRRFIKGYGPLVLVIDSVDDLTEPMDRAFFYYKLIPRLRQSYRLVVVGLSRNPSEERLRFKDSAPNLRALSLAGLSLDDLIQLAGQPISSSCTVKEALGLRVNDEERLRTITRKTVKLGADYDLASWNVRTLLCILASASHLERRGFTRQSLEESLKSGVTSLGPLTIGPPFEQAATPEITQILRQFFETGSANDWFIFNDKEGTYLWDSLARREVIRSSDTTLRMAGGIIWISSLFRIFDREPSTWKVFEMAHLARELRDRLLGGAKSTIHTQGTSSLCAEILRHFRRKGYAELHRSCGSLYFAARSQMQAHATITPDDVMALESMVLYGLLGQQELRAFIDSLGTNAQLPLILRLLRDIMAADGGIFQSTSKEIKELIASTESEIRVCLKWMLTEGHRQHFILPTLLLGERRDYWQDYMLGMPSLSGGFNLATASALQMLSDFGDIRQKDNFFSIWSSIAEGVVSVSQLTPTNWELFWVEYVALVLIVEVLTFSDPASGSYIYDHEGFRHDISLDFLSDEQFRLLADLASKVGLSMPSRRPSIVSVATLKSVLEAVDGLRLKCLLWSLGKLADSMVFYRAKFLSTAVNFHDLPKEARESLLMELQRLAAASPAMNRRSLAIEAMLVLYRLHFQLHRSLSSDTILELISRFHKLGCPGELVDALYDRYVQELRFSHDQQKMRLAVRLLLKRTRTSTLAPLKLAKIYCILSSEFLRLKKQKAAEMCLRRAKKSFDKADDPIRASNKTRGMLFSGAICAPF